jgi:AbrB family looped-hinge helix DNA binding protein
MAKVTSKYQVTLPKAIADQYNIRPGDHIDWTPAGEAIRVVPARTPPSKTDDPKTRLHWFDLATKRQRLRATTRQDQPPSDRGWKREDLYERGRSH